MNAALFTTVGCLLVTLLSASTILRMCMLYGLFLHDTDALFIMHRCGIGFVVLAGLGSAWYVGLTLGSAFSLSACDIVGGWLWLWAFFMAIEVFFGLAMTASRLDVVRVQAPLRRFWCVAFVRAHSPLRSRRRAWMGLLLPHCSRPATVIE